MAFSDASKFNEIITEIKELIDWYEDKHLDQITIRMFLSSGESFKYCATKNSIAHMLGIKTDYLKNCKMFNTTKSYELVKELLKNEHRISSKILSDEIKLSDIFKNHVHKKIEIFKSNISIGLENTLFVCKYDRNKAILRGEQPRNCDYIIIKEMDDGQIQELDVVKTDYIIKPVSSRMYESEQVAQYKFKKLLKDQDISILTSIIVNTDYYDEEKRFYLKERDKISKLQQLENISLKYNCNINVVGDCKYYYKRNLTGKNISRNNYDIISQIINCILAGKIIDINELGLLPVEITLQQKNLIDALNDKIIMVDNNSSINDEQNRKKYSELQKEVTALKEAKEVLLEENNSLKTQLDEVTTERNELKVNDARSKQLIKTFKSAINDFENPTE